MKISMARECAGEGGLGDEMVEKSVVPVRAFQPDCLLRISSAREMWRSLVDDGASLSTSDV